MGKKEHREQIEEQILSFLGRGKDITKLQPSTNMDFEIYLQREAVRRAGMVSRSIRRSSRSKWFVRGEGTV
jgi:hypothetical protein